MPEESCLHCPDGHADPLSKPWGVYVHSDRDGDGQPMYLMVAKSDGSHVSESDARWLWELIRSQTPGGAASRACPRPHAVGTDGAGGMNNLTKVSANFVPRTMAALEAASATTGDNQTDVLNRAVQVYAYISKVMDEGKLIFVEDPSTGSRERLILL